WAPYPGLSLYVTARYGAGIVAALLIAFAVHEEREHIILWGLLIGAVFQALYALAQTLNGSALGLTFIGEIVWPEDNLFNMAERNFRAYGLTIHPNNLSGYLLVGLFASVYMLRLRWRTQRTLLSIIAYVIATGLFLTFSRLAVVAAGLVMIPLLLLFIDVRWRPPRSWVTWVVVAVLVGGVALLGYRLADVVIFRFVNVFIYRDPLPARVTLGFADAANVMLNNWQAGAGNGNLMILAGDDSTLSWRLLLPPHNVYVIVLAELGLPGLILFLSGITATVYGAVCYRRYPLANLWSYCLLAMLAIMLLDYYFWLDYRSNMLVWWVLGLYWGNASVATDD
ncbi:MAG: O-antigen ligase family protein, partial [Chloroflexota bacterium]